MPIIIIGEAIRNMDCVGQAKQSRTFTRSWEPGPPPHPGQRLLAFRNKVNVISDASL